MYNFWIFLSIGLWAILEEYVPKKTAFLEALILIDGRIYLFILFSSFFSSSFSVFNMHVLVLLLRSILRLPVMKHVCTDIFLIVLSTNIFTKLDH